MLVDGDSESDEEEDDLEPLPSSESRFSNRPNDSPIILPSQRYVGARNVETVKDGKLAIHFSYVSMF